MEALGRSPSPLYTLVSHAPEAVRAPLQRVAARASELNVVWPVVAVVAAAAAGLVVATRLHGLDVATAAALGAESLVLVLFVIAVWDLVVRWGRITEAPLLTGPGPQHWAPQLLRHLGPPVFLAAGIALGHRFWT